MSAQSLPRLLRSARKAVSSENFQEAEGLYEKILAFPEMADDLDARLRYAYCTEKNGNIEQAMAAYSEVLQIYRESGDDGAAASLEKIVEKLRQGPEAEVEDAAEVDIEALDDAELMRRLCDMGELGLFHPGDVLCREGEMPDRLWLLQKGLLTVRMPDYDEPDSIDVKEGHLTLVGELGFFTNQRRSADVEAATLSEIYAVKTSDIRQEQQKDPAFKAGMQRLLIERWAEPVLTRHTVFERVNDIDRMRIMKNFKRVSMGPGMTLIEAGEEHPYAYMLQSGCMFFMHSKDEPNDKTDTDGGGLMTSIFPGDMIHLGGLLQDYKSDYRVVTATPVQLLRLSQEDFEPFTYRRPWIIQAIRRFSQRPTNLQVMKPEEDYLWKANRYVRIN